jgi:hypothetical protein
VCWSIAVTDKPTVGSPFLGAFPSDRNPKATKNVSVQFFINSSNSCKLYQRIPLNYTSEFWEMFDAPTYYYVIIYCTTVTTGHRRHPALPKKRGFRHLIQINLHVISGAF